MSAEAERRAAPADVAAALADVAGVGGYFAVAVGPAGSGGGGSGGDRAGWRPLADLYRDPAPLAGLIASVRARLGTDEDRVAASILYQGLAARLWSPVLAAAVAHRRVPDLAPDETYWRPASGPLPLLAPEPGGWEPGAGDLPGLVHRVAVEQHLVPLADAVRARIPVAAGLLWGNAASALVGTARALASARPDLDAAATGLVEALLGRAPLAGTGGFIRPLPGSDARIFLRRNCCLYYRVPGGGLCGDCALRAPAPGAPH